MKDFESSYETAYKWKLFENKIVEKIKETIRNGGNIEKILKKLNKESSKEFDITLTNIEKNSYIIEAVLDLARESLIYKAQYEYGRNKQIKE